MATADNENIATNTDEVISQIEEEKEEEQPVNVSKFEYIKIAKQTTSTVVLEWKYNDDKVEDGENPENPEKVFKIVKLKNRNEWETISWTRKSICVMKNLEQNTCYSIKILVMIQMPDQFDVIDSSEVFKVNISKLLMSITQTDQQSPPFSVLHTSYSIT